MELSAVDIATDKSISDDSSERGRSQIRSLEEDKGTHLEESIVPVESRSKNGNSVLPRHDPWNEKSTAMLSTERPNSVRSVRFSGSQINDPGAGNLEDQRTGSPNEAEYEEALSLPANIAYPPSSPPAYQSPPTMPKSEESKRKSDTANPAGRGTLNDLIMSKVALPFQQMMRRASRTEQDSDSDSQISEYSDSDQNTIHDFNQEEQQLLSFIDAYQPEEIHPRPLLRLFIMDYMPAIGDIDAMIKIPRPDEVEDNIGITQLDEPAIQQSDPTILAMQLHRASRDVMTQNDTPVKLLERADKVTHEIDKWINNIKELHRTRPSQSTVQFRSPMPDIENLMQEFHPHFEQALEGVKLPTTELDIDLEEYADICLGLLDIPVNRGRIQSLHCLFLLYKEFKNSQHFKNLAQNATEKRENVDRMEL
ncbi:hypothetical protein Y032_0094g2771 [Ancylostoma ceylanicum]|uniref:Intraflagellar transport protein 46 homolog n=1 Tax=Ancylostoma ceylanicum TaxID=53326 RepID=A0A016TKE0_9BILA|nr:hypothetical protein Y032_0094g2771 [Ancylostoma ceylanicum]